MSFKILYANLGSVKLTSKSEITPTYIYIYMKVLGKIYFMDFVVGSGLGT